MSRSSPRSHSIKGRNDEKVVIKAVDLFCGVGGLTCGLEATGIDVALGVDIDPDCEYPYEANNKAKFRLNPVEDLSGVDVSTAFEGASYTLLAGCAPCQPFSTYQQGKLGPTDERWNLLEHFGRLISEAQPDLVTMENVPRLEKQKVFSDFVSRLRDEGYFVSSGIVNCADYGVPQHRQRLVLLASKLGEIKIVDPIVSDGNRATVRNAIENLPLLAAGEVSASDRLHRASELSSLNLARIQASKPGGTWRDWDDHLVAECHRKSSGKTYPSVYGRMTWDDPAPTLTTQYYGFGSGRFGHPEQDRAISLREGAILQSFPRNYKFVPPRGPVYCKSIGRLIGNAVPVNLGKAIGRSIVRHVREHIEPKARAA